VDALGKLQGLSSEGQARLVEYGEDEIRSIVQGEYIGLDIRMRYPTPTRNSSQLGCSLRFASKQSQGKRALLAS
jgi:hypothetical protein